MTDAGAFGGMAATKNAAWNPIVGQKWSERAVFNAAATAHKEYQPISIIEQRQYRSMVVANLVTVYTAM